MPAYFFNEIIILIIAAFVGGFLARTLSFPPILGYIISGIVFGVVGKNFFPSYDSLLHLSQIGVSLLLFTLGFELSLEKLKKINKNIILVGLLQIFITSIVFIPLFLLFNFSMSISILFSVIFSFSSTAVVVKLLEEKGFLNDFPGNQVFILLLLQDLLVVPIIFLIPIFFSRESISTAQILLFTLSLIKTTGIFVFIFLISKFLLPKLINILFRYPSHELNILGTIFIAFLSIGLLNMAGLPETIAAFLAGILISEEGKNLGPLSEIRPFRDILLVLFFVLTGMLINIQFVAAHAFEIIFLSLSILIIKFAAVYLLLRIVGYVPTSSIFIASFLTNIGEFSAVVGQYAFSGNYINKEEYNILLSIFVFSLLLIPFWIKYFRELSLKLSRFKVLKNILGEVSYSFKSFPVSFTLENHVVICGHGRVGSQIRSLLDFAGVSYIVVDFNRKIIGDLSSKSKPVIYGDPSDEEVLKGTFIEKARILVIAVPDKISQKKIVKNALALNPKIVVLCRSHIEDDRYELFNLGVNSIVIPEFEAGIKIGTEVLEIFGHNNDSISFLIKRLRRENLM